jgi:hypothetical protein
MFEMTEKTVSVSLDYTNNIFKIHGKNEDDRVFPTDRALLSYLSENEMKPVSNGVWSVDLLDQQEYAITCPQFDGRLGLFFQSSSPSDLYVVPDIKFSEESEVRSWADNKWSSYSLVNEQDAKSNKYEPRVLWMTAKV